MGHLVFTVPALRCIVKPNNVCQPTYSMPVSNRCQLITYPDSMGGDLGNLRRVLDRFFQQAVGGVHILPFYPSSADRGFSPTTYYEVDERFGSYDEIGSITENYDLTCDFMVNHISRQSPFFRDFQAKKDSSEYADLFIRYKDFWPNGRPASEDLKKIYTRKPRPPFTGITFSDGSKEKIWCTFDHEQIDLNLSSQKTKEIVADFLRFLCSRGADMIRLDAFAYATKKPGTGCFFLEPEVWDILSFISEVVSPYQVDLLPEVHEHYSYQLKLAEKGYWVYDFALPMLLLQALYDGDARNLKRWFTICPKKQVTTLDTHDGIGVVDVYGLMSDSELERTRENLYSRGANVKRIYNTPEYQNLDIYQINCTYYSALGNDDAAYLFARAVQFFAPGIPHVYYVGLLAGENDVELVEATKVGRDINRHVYSAEEIENEVKRPVVKRLLDLMQFRNNHPAFDGDFTLEKSDDKTVRIVRNNGAHWAVFEGDVVRKRFTITSSSDKGGKEVMIGA